MKVRRWVLLIGLAALLTSCGQWNIAPRVDVYGGLTPTTLGFEIQQDGTIVVASHALTVISRRGSLGAIVDGYRIDYLDATGNEIVPGASSLYSRGSLSLVVPPGLTCLEENIALCTAASPGVRFIERVAEPVSNFITLPGEIAIAILQTQNSVGTRANIYLYGVSDLGNDVILGPFEAAISYPVAN